MCSQISNTKLRFKVQEGEQHGYFFIQRNFFVCGEDAFEAFCTWTRRCGL